MAIRVLRVLGIVLMLVALTTSLAVTVAGKSTGTTNASIDAGKGCICPMIYAPVLCDNGRTYTNGCFASCAGAHNCHLVGPGPIQL